MMDRSDNLFETDSFSVPGGVMAGSATDIYDPPAVDRDQLALTNRLCQRRSPVAVSLGDAVVAVAPIGLGTIGALAPPVARMQFWFTIDSRPLVLQMARGLYERILSRVDPELLAADVDREILPLLLESCVEDGLAAVEARLGSRVELVAVQPGAAFDLEGLDIALEVSIDGQKAGIAALSASYDDIEHLADLFATRAKPPRSYGDLKVELRFRPGSIWLDLGELRALKPGDVLLMESDTSRWSLMAATAGEHWLFPIEMTSKGPTVRAPFRRAGLKDQEEWMMVENSQVDRDDEAFTGLVDGKPKSRAGRPQGEPSNGKAAGDPDDPLAGEGGLDIGQAAPPADAAFDDLPIKLVFEFGRLEMPLGQLQDIGPGYVFELERPLGEAVEITAGGRRIGQGEVVRIDDQIGVRVVRLFGQAEA